jgi:hypothetical protein
MSRLSSLRSHQVGPPPSIVLGVLAGLLLAGSPGVAFSESITGVCPDGSIFIVQSAASIPCRHSKQVAPGDVPPIKPEFLPRPYAWELFNRQQDPNNPYNLIDTAAQIRDAGAAGAGVPTVGSTPSGPGPALGSGTTPPGVAPSTLAPIETAPPIQTAAVQPGQGAPDPDPDPDLGLSDYEVRDLLLIVEFAQRSAPAAFPPEEGNAITVLLAQSAAFEPRLRQARDGLPAGAVLLFAAVALDEADFHANLTFVQGHSAFQPETANPDHLGVIRGRLGSLEADEAVLGYVVLPEGIDTGKPLDIYWNDRMLTTVLQPPAQ